MLRIFTHSVCGQSLLLMLKMTLTMIVTMTGLEAIRVFDNHGSRKSFNTQRIDHKIRASLPIQYDFPYRYVFPANHPFSSYPQFLGLPPAATPSYNGGVGGSGTYELYGSVASPGISSNLYQHQHLHQHQHQLQLQPPPPQPQPGPQPQPPLPPQIAQAEFKYTLKPTISSTHHAQQTFSNSLATGPFQQGSFQQGSYQQGSVPTILLLHATNPTAGSVQTFLLIPASTTNGGQSLTIGTPLSPNLLNAINGGTLSLSSGNSGGGIIAGTSQVTLPSAAAAAAHAVPPQPAPIVLRAAGHTKIANSHYHNQLSAAQLLTRPLGGVYQLPLMPPNAKYYKRKKSSIEAKMSQADGHGVESPSISMSTSTETTVPEIRNGHSSRISVQEETSSDTFNDYVPENGPTAPKRS